MKSQIPIAILAAGVGILLAQAPPRQPHRIGPAEIYPDPAMTPGATNPQVSKRNIKGTICNRRWSTRLIRPPANYTKQAEEKTASGIRGYFPSK
jgi:hypothetical protein